MHRGVSKAIVALFFVVEIFSSAAVASAETKVACVGDSITEMPGWCMDLGTKLGAGYNVGNFGVSGTNLLKNVGQPYWDSVQFTPSHDFGANIVIIMLGTNDAIPANWSGKDHFVADYEALIDSYTSLASHPRVYSILPPPIGESPFGHDGNILATEVVPMIKQAAMDKGVTTIDVFTAFGGTNFDASLFGGLDQVHPGDTGHQLIADTVYAVLMSSGGLGGAGTGGSAGSGGSGNTGGAGGGGKAGGSGNTGGASGSSASTGGMGGGSANTGGAGVGGKAGSSGNTAGSGNIGSSDNTGSSAAFAGAGGNSTTNLNAIIGAAGTSVPLVTTPASSGCGCRVAGNVTSKSGPVAVLLLLLGIAIRRRKRRHTPMVNA
jgi:MYXO-CTERM domain-containing protein